MIKRLKTYWAKRKQACKDKRYKGGYVFATTELCRQGKIAEKKIDAAIECSLHFNDYDDFDKGCEAALKYWRTK